MSKKLNEEKVYFKLQEERQKRKPKFKFRDLARTAKSTFVIFKKLSDKEILQITLTYIQEPQIYTIHFQDIKSFVYPKDIIKNYWDQQN